GGARGVAQGRAQPPRRRAGAGSRLHHVAPAAGGGRPRAAEVAGGARRPLGRAQLAGGGHRRGAAEGDELRIEQTGDRGTTMSDTQTAAEVAGRQVEDGDGRAWIALAAESTVAHL